MIDTTQATQIAHLNDAFRKTLLGGQVMLTAGVQALSELEHYEVFRKVQTFDDFSEDNDPYGEHDFGAFEVGGKRLFWKIDYYDPTLTFGSEDPADPAKTKRVMTLMLAEEY
ncbi:DUF3768 domain-containing protein [Vampirovibrio chlorellavorus]|uniref:DUF3768 domain-containing protein n=1 Tax=Vampirovibrio chlorellavorus TaxID=758823 RepID=UPI0026F31EFB|nr:DUF3768 domain-containing protein [Vampirovibrio chlorellavorus]